MDINNTSVDVAYDERLMNWQLGTGHPTNPIRARLAVKNLRDMGVPLRMHDVRPAALDELALVHDVGYLETVLAEGISDEWVGVRKDLAGVASLMFGGTMGLVDRMLMEPSIYRLGFAPMGAKHHAMRDRSSGFCVFNDMAAAAVRFASAGMRVMYVDWDAHHGDGVEALLRDAGDAVVTYSVHDGTIFPGTGHHSEPDLGVFNWALPAGAGDEWLAEAMRDMREVARAHRPDVLLVACGADGHKGDPLTSLAYTTQGLRQAAQEAASWPVAQVLIGGAGGYQPFDVTPLVWAQAVQSFQHSRSVAGTWV